LGKRESFAERACHLDGEARVCLAGALRLAVGRHNGASEAKARGLGKAARHVANMANFAAQANFAAHH
jgi:hypothetical protein